MVERSSGFRLRIEDHVIDPRGGRTYRVEQVNGPWLWLKAEGEGLCGWARADHVVAVEQAIAFFTDSTRADPGDAHGYTMRGIVWLREKKEPDLALRDFNEAIRIHPRGSYVYLNRGVAWNDKREYDRAIADYAEAIHLDPELAPAYLGRGWARQMKREYDEAIIDYTEAIRLDPRYILAHSNRGVAWAAKREYDRALADYAEAIHLDLEFASPYNNRAWIWATCPDTKYRDGERAIESATRACELAIGRGPNSSAPSPRHMPRPATLLPP